MQHAPSSSALRFAEAARRLAAATHDAGLAVPAFRCPPRVEGASRTIRRFPGGAVVSVRLRGRPFADSVADMVEGVLVANAVDASVAADLRATLAAAAAEAGEPTEPVELAVMPAPAPVSAPVRQVSPRTGAERVPGGVHAEAA